MSRSPMILAFDLGPNYRLSSSNLNLASIAVFNQVAMEASKAISDKLPRDEEHENETPYSAVR